MSEERYSLTMDPYPQETKEATKLYRFYELLREGKLTTTKCKDCSDLMWPPRTVCPECLCDDLDWVELPKSASIYSFSVQVGGIPPGYEAEAPLVYAIIEFGNGMRMLTRIVESNSEDLKVGAQVELKVIDIPRDRVIPYFKLKTSA